MTWSLVGPNAQVAALEGGTLKLGFAAPGLARAFSNARHTSAVEEAVYQTLGIRVRVEATLDEGPPGGGGTSGGGASGGGPAGGGGVSGGGSGPTPSSGEPRREAPAPAAAPEPDWPDVPAPGGGTASVVSSAGMSAANGSASGGQPGLAGASAQGSVAVAERPEPSRPELSGPEAGRPAPSRPVASPPSASSAADEAWLSGASTTEPPSDYDMPEPEPVYEDQAPPPAGAPVSGAGSAREALRQANERRARAANGASTEQRKGASASAPGAASRDEGPDFYDEPSADDPDITSAGLVGVSLVVQVLGGTVIDEIVEQP